MLVALLFDCSIEWVVSSPLLVDGASSMEVLPGSCLFGFGLGALDRGRGHLSVSGCAGSWWCLAGLVFWRPAWCFRGGVLGVVIVVGSCF